MALLLAVFAIGPLLQPGYFWSAHDARNSVYFLFEFDRSIRDGILWPRWGPDWGFGYGYPFWNIYAPLAYYVGELMVLLGLEYTVAVKWVFALSILGSAASMYFFARRLLGTAGGLVASLIYVYAPYHLFDLYVRAALAESFAFVFIPLVFWGFFELVAQPRLRALLGTAFAYTGLVLTSNVLLVLITPCVVAYVGVLALWRAFREQRPGQRVGLTFIGVAGMRGALPGIAAFLLGTGLQAIFLLPALAERNYVRLDQWFGGRYTFGDDFVYFHQLFSPAWGFGASVPGPDDKVGFQLGLLPFVLFCLSFLTVARVRNDVVRWTLRFWQVVTLGAIFLMTPASSVVWHAVPILTTVQFPWRLGILTTTGFAVLGGAIMAGRTVPSSSATVTNDLPRWRMRSLIPLVLLILSGAYPYLIAEVRDPLPTEGPVSLAALFRYQQASDEMTGTTAWARRIPSWSPLAEQVVRGENINTKVNYSAIPNDGRLGVHSVEMSTVHELVWVYAADDQQSVTFLTAYYPGWNAYIYEDLKHPQEDLKARVGRLIARAAIRTTPDEGWIVVSVPQGEHFLELRFEDTPVRVVGKVVSAFSLALALSLLVLDVKKRRREGRRVPRGLSAQEGRDEGSTVPGGMMAIAMTRDARTALLCRAVDAINTKLSPSCQSGIASDLSGSSQPALS
ncbi:MAG: glycosyltransferase family 39 protein [Anaerolineae bacterium]|nr:glycosyltransferase family 39 protein [Anaerolineae bacterium]